MYYYYYYHISKKTDNNNNNKFIGLKKNWQYILLFQHKCGKLHIEHFVLPSVIIVFSQGATDSATYSHIAVNFTYGFKILFLKQKCLNSNSRTMVYVLRNVLPQYSAVFKS